jgi:uncharacterized protein YcbX
MMGEELNATDVTERGVLGDRAYALVDTSDGKLVSAKNPRKWLGLFDYRAAFTEPPQADQAIPPVRITLPDGAMATSGQDDVNQIVSAALGRQVTLETSPPDQVSLEEYWPDIEGLDHRDEVTDEALPSGAFFDGAAIHLLTTATLDGLRRAHPDGRFEVRRFRPNIVVEASPGEADFPENEWIGRTIAIGEQVRISITGPCPRCVMTTLAQGDLPDDRGILRTAAKQNQAHVGVYAKVVQGGQVRRGDLVTLED